MFPTVARFVFAGGLLAIGVQNLVCGDFLPELQPVPDWVAGRSGLAYAVGAIVIGAAAFVIAGRHVQRAARVLVVVLGLWVVALHAPQLIANPSNGGAWTSALEILAFAAAAWLLAVAPHAAIAKLVFGCTFVGFAILHVIYADYVAFVIPAWIPGHVFWAYATAAAHAAAGLAIASGVVARIAAIMLGAMLGSWVLLLHLPRVVEANTRPEWTSMLVALTMCGAAWVVAVRSRE
ncbi:MAG: hypothetical protein ABI867_27595 [Kofleriaceae bacterium]